MSFKNFSYLNTALRGFTDTSGREAVDVIANAVDRIRSLASSVTSNYAKAYSQVQWMKYDGNGNPADVTPVPQNTVPESVLAAVKQEVENAVSAISALGSAGVQTTVQMPLEIGAQISTYGYYATDVSPYFTRGSRTIDASNFCMPTPYYRGTFHPSALPTIFNVGITGHKGLAVPESQVTLTLTMGSHNGHCLVMGSARKDDSHIYILFALDRATGDARVWLPTTGDYNYETSFDPADSNTFTAFMGTFSGTFTPDADMFVFWKHVVETITIAGEQITANMIAGSFPTLDIGLGSLTSAGGDVTVTVSNISPQAMVNGYDDLLAAIRNL